MSLLGQIYKISHTVRLYIGDVFYIYLYGIPFTDYDPDYLDSKLKMQYLLSGKSQRENNFIFVKLMNQRFFVLLKFFRWVLCI